MKCDICKKESDNISRRLCFSVPEGKICNMCDNCGRKQDKEYAISESKRKISLLEKRVGELVAPNCPNCQMNAIKNPYHNFCYSCGAPSYSDCLCDVYRLEKEKRNFGMIKRGANRGTGIINITPAKELLFVCPVHGEVFSDGI